MREDPKNDSLASGFRTNKIAPADQKSKFVEAYFGGSDVRFGSRVDGAMARAFLTLLQHWSGAVTCPAC
jgi:hypothetical protein